MNKENLDQQGQEIQLALHLPPITLGWLPNDLSAQPRPPLADMDPVTSGITAATATLAEFELAFDFFEMADQTTAARALVQWLDIRFEMNSTDRFNRAFWSRLHQDNLFAAASKNLIARRQIRDIRRETPRTAANDLV